MNTKKVIHLSINAPAHVISHYHMRGYEIIFVL